MAASRKNDNTTRNDIPVEDVMFEEADPFYKLGVASFEKSVKDTPCKFHDGFSGRCWKGSSCPYSHALYSGGKFAEKHPELAFATSIRQVVTSVHRLPEKFALNEERQVKCRVVHSVTPSEFFIRPVEEDAHCLCKEVDVDLKRNTQKEASNYANVDVPMDPYFFGLSVMDAAHENTQEAKASTFEDELHSFLSQAFNYTRFQNLKYTSKVDLVAAYVNKKWKRGIVSNQLENPRASVEYSCIRVQLLESGEKTLLPMKHVCRLPEKFTSKPTSAYRCMLWGFSPFFFHWTKRAVNNFQEMVEGKVVFITVKTRGASTQTFERTPYLVQVRIEKEEGGWMDVGQELYSAGLCLEWNPFPYRPFAVPSVDTKCLEAVTNYNAQSLPPKTVEIENNRLQLSKDESPDDERGEGCSDSGSDTLVG